MNFVASLVRVLLLALLRLSPVKAASINKEVEKSKNEVVTFNQVYMKSLCQPRDVLVDVYQEFPEDTEHTYVPSCVVLRRCGGCCSDEAMECVPTQSHQVTLQFVSKVMRFRARVAQKYLDLDFTEHLRCECRRKVDVDVDMPTAAKKE